MQECHSNLSPPREGSYCTMHVLNPTTVAFLCSAILFPHFLAKNVVRPLASRPGGIKSRKANFTPARGMHFASLTLMRV